jgi:hypothetical protein
MSGDWSLEVFVTADEARARPTRKRAAQPRKWTRTPRKTTQSGNKPSPSGPATAGMENGEPSEGSSAALGEEAEEAEEAEEEISAAAQRRLLIAGQVMRASNRAASALDIEAAVATAEQHDHSFLDAAALRRRDAYVKQLLVKAGHGLVESLEKLTTDDDFWQELENSEIAIKGNIDFETEMTIRELTTHELPYMLTALGYNPPPEASYWTDWMQEPLRSLVDAPFTRIPRSTALARRELTFFVWRLRYVVNRAEEELGAGSTAANNIRPNLGLRRRLAWMVRAGRERAIPAALGAGVAGLIAAGPFGALTGATGGAVVGFASEATKEAAKIAVQAACAEGLAMLPARSRHMDLPVGEVLSANMIWVRAYSDWLAPSASDEDFGLGRFMMRRGLFSMLQAAEELPGVFQSKLWNLARDVIDAVGEEPPDHQEIVRRLESLETFIELVSKIENGSTGA